MEIDDLKSMIGSSEGDWVADFEIAAEEYYNKRRAAAVIPLISLLGDDLPNEVNFTIIHIVEQTPSVEYVKSLVDVVVAHGGQGSYWLNVLHYRIFNSPPDLAAYADVLKTAEPAAKRMVQHYLSGLSMNPRNARFKAQIDLLQQIVGG
jgi:hypothetical protein